MHVASMRPLGACVVVTSQFCGGRSALQVVFPAVERGVVLGEALEEARGLPVRGVGARLVKSGDGSVNAREAHLR